MEERSKHRLPTGWLIGVAMLAVGTIAAVAIAPSEAQADCDAGSTCALFVNDAGVELDVCAVGFEPDQILSLAIYEPGTYNTVQSFQWVR